MVIVGFGAAGASAALEATEHGASVLALDRFHGGGATAASGAVVYAGGGTVQQTAAGFDDTAEEMCRYLRLEVGDAVSGVTLHRFCAESAGNLAWLEAAGVPFEASLCPFKTSYPPDRYYLYFSGNEQVTHYRGQARPAPRGHRAKGPGISGLTLYRALERAARERGIQLRTQTQVQQLVISADGRVTGVEGRALAPGSAWAALHGRLSRINAKATTYVPGLAARITAALDAIMALYARPYRARGSQGVILAAGGFVFDPEMVEQHAPLYRRCRPLGTPGDDGAGIRLGESAGGATARLDRFTAWRFFVPPQALLRGVLIDRKGQRLANEEMYGATLGRIIVEHGGDAHLVCDRPTYLAARQALRAESAPFQLLAMGLMFVAGHKKASTLGALAAKIGIAPEGLEATMAAYNEAAHRGGPDPLGKTAANLVPQEAPPYYAIDCSLDARHGVPCTAMSLGGLVVDEETGQVLRAGGAAIPGLYAAGRNAVGVCSEQYVSGLSIADGVFSGRRAGCHAALDGAGRRGSEP